MAIIRKHLVLEFEATNGSKVELKVLKPLESLNGTDIKGAMDKIAATGAYGAESPATKVVGAKYDTREIQDITLA